MKKFSIPIYTLIVLVILLSACSNDKEPGNPDLASVSISSLSPSNTPAPSSTHTIEPTPKPTNTPAPTNTFTPTPVPWKSYRMVYSLEWGYFPNASKLWIPVAIESNGVGMKNVVIERIQPEPDDLFPDMHGNLIAFWGEHFRHYQTYSITFTVDLATNPINLSPQEILVDDPYWGLSTEEVARYTNPNPYIPSDDQRFIRLAREIVGDQTNPFEQAVMVHRYVREFFGAGGPCHIEGTDPYPYSIIGAYERQCGACGEYNGLFITLLRTLGVPARYNAGHHFPHAIAGDFPGGNTREDSLGFHVWSEVYFPPYGWVQVDATDSRFNKFSDLRLVLFRGDAIELGHGYPFESIPYFHYPYVNVKVGGGWPESHTMGENISLVVQELP